jgi:hypothetical protein
MPHIDLSQALLNEDESPAVEPIADGETRAITLGLALRRLMLMDIDHNRQPITGEAKITRYDLYLKLKAANGAVDLTPEEIVLLRQAALSFVTLTAGQVRAMLDVK